MYVCICKQVRSAEIEAAVHQGATRLQDVSRKLGVGRQCGTCARHARQLIQKLAHVEATPDPTASAA